MPDFIRHLFSLAFHSCCSWTASYWVTAVTLCLKAGQHLCSGSMQLAATLQHCVPVLHNTMAVLVKYVHTATLHTSMCPLNQTTAHVAETATRHYKYCTFVCTYVHTYVCTCVCTMCVYVRAYVRMYLHMKAPYLTWSCGLHQAAWHASSMGVCTVRVCILHTHWVGCTYLVWNYVTRNAPLVQVL